MVFGGIERERLQLNEDTLWSGGPKDWNNPKGPAVLAEVRRLIATEQYAAADVAAKGMQGPFTQSYLPMGDYGPNPLRNYSAENSGLVKVLARYPRGAKTFTAEAWLTVTVPDYIPRIR